MNNIKAKIELLKKRIKILLKIKNIFSFIMGKITIVQAGFTIKHAIEDAWKTSKEKRM